MKKFNFYIALICLFTLTQCANRSTTVITKRTPLISDSLQSIISIDTVKIDNIENQLNLSGEVNFDENKVVKIFPNASGQVLSVNVSVGDRIKKGQLLAVIKSADVAANYADLKNATSNAAIAAKEFKNAEQLYKNGISSEKEYIQAKLEYDKAETEVNKVQSGIMINGGGKTNAGGMYMITAPRNGYIVEKNVTTGSFIRNDNSQNLFTISDIQDVWIWANVFEADIQKVKLNNEAEITTLAYPDKIFYGKVDQINAVLDPASKAMKIRIVLPNPGMLLKPQMFTKININHRENERALVIPSKAIVFDGGKNYVLVYKNKFNIQVRPVDILKVLGDQTYIKSGLTEGELVISKNQILLYNSLSDNNS